MGFGASGTAVPNPILCPQAPVPFFRANLEQYRCFVNKFY
jgi:hypothetical protein